MGKILCFIYDDMADWEITFLCNSLCLDFGVNSKELVTIAVENKQIKSKAGFNYIPNIDLEQALSLNNIDGIIIPGGWNDNKIPLLEKLINKIFIEKKLIAAICAGPKYLAYSGILNDIKYTTTLSPEYFTNKGIEDPFPRKNYIQTDLVRHKNIITAKYNAFIDFSFECCDWFGLFKSEKEKKEKEIHFKNIKKMIF